MAINSYPFKKYNYRVEIDSIDVAAFSEISGFDRSIDVIEYREGSEKTNSFRKIPGLTHYNNLTLRWGITQDSSFYEWVTGISDGSKNTAEDRVKTVTIYLQDDSHSDVASWTLFNAWPCRYSAPDMNASSSEIAFESIELVFEEMLRNVK